MPTLAALTRSGVHTPSVFGVSDEVRPQSVYGKEYLAAHCLGNSQICCDMGWAHSVTALTHLSLPVSQKRHSGSFNIGSIIHCTGCRKKHYDDLSRSGSLFPFSFAIIVYSSTTAIISLTFVFRGWQIAVWWTVTPVQHLVFAFAMTPIIRVESWTVIIIFGIQSWSFVKLYTLLKTEMIFPHTVQFAYA